MILILIYNIVLLLLSIIASPLIILKSITNKRLRYRLFRRFFPQSLNTSRYALIHASSFGEIKTILNFIKYIEKQLDIPIILSVFTDTAHTFLKNNLKNEKTVLMPLDLYPLYKKIFLHPPEIAIFFETEIWPSFIFFLKKHDSKLILINARMSERSYRTYKAFKFIFKKIISSFDLIIAKSKIDAKRFKDFSRSVIVCGNIKKYRKPLITNNTDKNKTKEELMIKTEKPILTLASFHKEEIDLATEIVETLKERYFIILAPRHIEDVPLFEKTLNRSGIKFAKRTTRSKAKYLLILDTMGELEKAYAISEVSIIGGSFSKQLKGHNPIEALLYGNIVICGEYMESFEEEVETLKKFDLIKQLRKDINIIDKIKEILEHTNKLDIEKYFKNISYILNCYLIYIKKIKEKT